MSTEATKKIITSQDYIDAAIVEEKRASKDYAIMVAEVTVDGEDLLVMIDGHHSLEAAILDGVEPEVQLATAQDHDAIGEYEGCELLDMLQDGPQWIDAVSKTFVW